MNTETKISWNQFLELCKQYPAMDVASDPTFTDALFLYGTRSEPSINCVELGCRFVEHVRHKLDVSDYYQVLVDVREQGPQYDSNGKLLATPDLDAPLIELENGVARVFLQLEDEEEEYYLYIRFLEMTPVPQEKLLGKAEQ